MKLRVTSLVVFLATFVFAVGCGKGGNNNNPPQRAATQQPAPSTVLVRSNQQGAYEYAVVPAELEPVVKQAMTVAKGQQPSQEQQAAMAHIQQQLPWQAVPQQVSRFGENQVQGVGFVQYPKNDPRKDEYYKGVEQRAQNDTSFNPNVSGLYGAQEWWGVGIGLGPCGSFYAGWNAGWSCPVWPVYSPVYSVYPVCYNPCAVYSYNSCNVWAYGCGGVWI